MPELTAKERLQPSLLDRLADDEPDKTLESRDRRILSSQGLRQAVLRDLTSLLNTTSLGVLQNVSSYPQVESSVLNYGLMDLSGQTASGIDTLEVERQLAQAIRNFEPRILSDTLEIHALSLGEENASEPNRLAFEIEGELWGQPLPERLYLKTEYDLDLGSFQVMDAK